MFSVLSVCLHHRQQLPAVSRKGFGCRFHFIKDIFCVLLRSRPSCCQWSKASQRTRIEQQSWINPLPRLPGLHLISDRTELIGAVCLVKYKGLLYIKILITRNRAFHQERFSKTCCLYNSGKKTGKYEGNVLEIYGKYPSVLLWAQP